MQCGGLRPLLPAQRAGGKRGGDDALTLNCSLGTHTRALNCLDCAWVSVPPEQHRARRTEESAKGMFESRPSRYTLSNCFSARLAYTVHLSHLKMYTTKDGAGRCVGSWKDLPNGADSAWAACLSA